MNFQTCGFDRLAEYESNEFARVVSTAILSVTYRISSELRSQATAGLVSTTVGDHVGIRGAVGSSFCSVFLLACRPFFKQSYNSQFNNSSRGHTHLTNGRRSLWGIFPRLAGKRLRQSDFLMFEFQLCDAPVISCCPSGRSFAEENYGQAGRTGTQLATQVVRATYYAYQKSLSTSREY